MFKRYLTEDEFYQKYSPYQKGQTVTIIKPIYTDDGKFETGMEFIITNISLKPDIEFPKVFSDEADSYYADKRMFCYQVQPKESCSENTPTFNADIKHFTNVRTNMFKCAEVILAIMVLIVCWYILHLQYVACESVWNINPVEIDDLKKMIFCIFGYVSSFLLFIDFIFSTISEKPTIHKKLKKHNEK